MGFESWAPNATGGEKSIKPQPGLEPCRAFGIPCHHFCVKYFGIPNFRNEENNIENTNENFQGIIPLG